jgi:hypothetical protein
VVDKRFDDAELHELDEREGDGAAQSREVRSDNRAHGTATRGTALGVAVLIGVAADPAPESRRSHMEKMGGLGPRVDTDSDGHRSRGHGSWVRGREAKATDGAVSKQRAISHGGAGNRLRHARFAALYKEKGAEKSSRGELSGAFSCTALNVAIVPVDVRQLPFPPFTRLLTLMEHSRIWNTGYPLGAIVHVSDFTQGNAYEDGTLWQSTFVGDFFGFRRKDASKQTTQYRDWLLDVGLRLTSEVEVKLSRHTKDERCDWKGCGSWITLGLLIEGHFQIEFRTQGTIHAERTVELREAGDFVIYRGAGYEHWWQALDDSTMVTVRWRDVVSAARPPEANALTMVDAHSD